MKDIKEATFNSLARKADWMLTGDVAKAVGVSRVTIVQYLRELMGERLVERKRLGKASMWRVNQADRPGSRTMLAGEDNEIMQQIYAEREAYLKLRSVLLADAKYAGRFVAILKGKAVDVDSDERELVRRVYEKYGYVAFYVEKVQGEKRVLEVPSPERVSR